MKTTWYYFGGLACWLFSLFFYLQPRIWMVEWGYRIAELQKLVTVQEEEAQTLKMERNQLRSPQRINQIARKELKMTLPKADQVILVERKE